MIWGKGILLSVALKGNFKGFLNLSGCWNGSFKAFGGSKSYAVYACESRRSGSK